LGCWRSHANVWQRVIEEDVGTAIILEDDIDWDVNIHAIFEELSVQMRKGELREQNATEDEIMNAPYGKNSSRLGGQCLVLRGCADENNYRT
jgi:GR25 family glycosyltransferase involved in LPS biosynthesis